uniref:Uncharacterized protein n=1 Tax=Arundo donax TaxID=35708 RepID=A0A0A9EBY7_ARUDO
MYNSFIIRMLTYRNMKLVINRDKSVLIWSPQCALSVRR